MPDGNSSEATTADDALLRQCAAVIADAKLLESRTWTLWRDEVSPMLVSVFAEEVSMENGQTEGMSHNSSNSSEKNLFIMGRRTAEYPT